jgi:hypothetical protein
MADEQRDLGDDDDEGGGRRTALIALVVVVVLALGGLWLARLLHGTSAIQDCVMSGRTNCAPIR